MAMSVRSDLVARPALAALALVGLLLAGCAEDPAASSAEGASDDLTVDANRPAPVFSNVVTGPAVGPDLNATTASAPRLVPGEWWRLQYTSGFYDTEHVEFVRVVAAASPEGYIFGMPHEGWYKEAIAYHAPAFGDVALDLSYATHNERFEPVRFPLVAGDEWDTVFATSPLRAVVESADETTAVVAFHSPTDTSPMAQVMNVVMPPGTGPAMRITYDARMHEVVKMESFIGTWEVVEHGYGFEGWVTVPRGEHTAIDYGTFLPANAGGDPGVARTIEVSGGFNRLTMMHFIAPLGPGMYRITSTPPEGEAFVTEMQGQDQAVRFYEATNPDGTWQAEDLVAGPGVTYSMGIAYHQYDIQVPGGARRSDHAHEVFR
jgi:hypothetical protein